MPVSQMVLDGLQRICGEEHVRAGVEGDAIGEVVPGYVTAPGSTEAAAKLMSFTAKHGLRVVARGGGTKVQWGMPPSACDLLVESSRLNRIEEIASGDLVVRAQAGMPLRMLQRELARTRQQLALDAPAASTLGGIVATAVSGPRRLLYGGPRDMLIGVTVVRADGQIARSGGKVVKNVAGYDLGKLFTGSYGTLGLIVETVFRLHSLPQAARYVTALYPYEYDAHRAAQAVIDSQLVPSAVEIFYSNPSTDGAALAVLLEGSIPGVNARAAVCRALLGPSAEVADAPPAWWGRYRARSDQVLIKLSVPIGVLHDVLRTVLDGARGTGPELEINGSAGTGIVHIIVSKPEPASVCLFINGLRRTAIECDGSAVVLQAPAVIRESLDLWGPIRGQALMRRVKDQFDPEHRLAPGRFVGGL